MMHIVHSVFSEADNQNQSRIQTGIQHYDEDFYIRLQAHRQVCHKYREEILAIRKYLPQWKPEFSCE